jgi:hypothetical protein
MNGHLMRVLLALYPRAFRDRYGAELASLTDDLISAGELTPLRAVLNLVWGATLEWGRVLFYSRRVAQAMAAAAIVAVAGSLYITSQARPQSTPGSAHGASVTMVTYQSGGCAFWAESSGSAAILAPAAAATKAAAKPGRFSWVLVRHTGVVPGKLSFKTQPLPAGAAHASRRPSPARLCVMVIKPLPEGWMVRSVPGSIVPKPPS